jgi:hypothetical protein
MAMRQYERLSEDKRTSRCTIADAIAVLEQSASFGPDDTAIIQVGRLPLLSGEVVGIVQVIFDLPCSEKSYVVSLPTSTQFYSRRSDGARWDIGLLHKGVVDSTGRLVLTTGASLHAVELVPARLPLEPTELDYRIVHATTVFAGGRQTGYRKLREEPNLQDVIDQVPDLQFLDLQRIQNLPIPSLDSIAVYLKETAPSLPVPSKEKIATALLNFGMRFRRRR